MSWIYWLFNIHDHASVEGIESWEVAARSAVPGLLIGLIIAAGVILAVLNFTSHIILRRGRRTLLFALRLAGLALILVLILQLEANLVLHRSRPVQVAVVTDISESMSIRDVNEQSRLAAAVSLIDEKLVPRFGNKARLSYYNANWEVSQGRPTRDTEAFGPTDLGTAIKDSIRHSGTPRALILLTDGKTAHQDRLIDAAQIAKQSGVQLFGVCLGQTGPARVSVRVTDADAYVRLGDELSLSAEVSLTGELAEGLSGRTVEVFLFEGEFPEPRMQRRVELGETPRQVTFRYRPTQPGRHRYRIEVGRVEGTTTDLTNVVSTMIEVIDEPIRVLLVEGTPRFELKFQNIWIARDPVIELTSVVRMPRGGWFVMGAQRHERIDEGLPITAAELFEYDVIIMGDVPRSVFRQGGDMAETKLTQLVEFVVKRGGGLLTVGGQSVYGAGQYQGSALVQILPFEIDGMANYQLDGLFHIIPSSAALAHPVMAFNQDTSATREAWDDLPKLEGNNVVGRLKPAASLLAYRLHEDKVYPVIATHDVGRGRVLSMTADTTWRWQLQRREDEVDNYRKFWGRAIRYVAADPRTRPGKANITAQSSRPVVGTQFPLATTLLDPTYGPVRNADLRVEVQEPSGKIFMMYPSDSSTQPGLYRYSVPLRERGLYRVTAVYEDTETVHEIIAGDAPAEMDDAGADIASLRYLAAETGGAAGTPDDIEDVLAAIPLQPEYYMERVSVAMWNLPLVAGLLIFIVCADCFIRKRNGLV